MMCHFKCDICGREVTVLDLWHRYEYGKKVYYCTKCMRPLIDETDHNGFVLGV